MRPGSAIGAPLFLFACYYLVLVGLVWLLETLLAPGIMPLGGLDELLASDSNKLEVVREFGTNGAAGGYDVLTLGLAIAGAVLLMLPVSWVYFMTTRRKRIDRSFVQTMIVLPVIVAGIAIIVQNSLALAFSLAGIVAAVRFRFTLTEPAHALYIFSAIAVGLGAGVSALGVSFVISLAFVAINLLLWRLNYGANMTSPFFAFLTGRGQDDDQLP